MREVIKLINLGIIFGTIVIIVALTLIQIDIKIHQANIKIHQVEAEAVKVGVARWNANINGEPEFEWITNNVNIQK
jgi:hypothetical protein